MRTKTLVCAAAIAAAAITSVMAQSNVYSLNIVGYANVPVPRGFSFHSNPFDNGTNGAAQVFDNSAGAWNAYVIHQWNGSGFSQSAFDNDTGDTSTGFLNALDNTPIKAPVLTNGWGYLVQNPTGSPVTNTYVGSVHSAIPGTNIVIFAASTANHFVGSMLPLAGTPAQLMMDNTAGLWNGVTLGTLVVNGSGQALGYNQVYFDNDTGDTSTGFLSALDNTPAPAPVFIVGSGFLLSNPNGTAVSWSQVLTNSP